MIEKLMKIQQQINKTKFLKILINKKDIHKYLNKGADIIDLLIALNYFNKNVKILVENREKCIDLQINENSNTF